ncbi:hypothetical protein POK33_37795 [Burkholderia cenocepacia]|uniref:hypothetical protein n=1 Tax=Burkholderia cenocepacia TaxID=95486 RepID=UPI0023BA0436|nr:hypothetical protein [Burkholderia cenocepacia]MDF0506510.1 hypothetical protein [Burkholderia cenocepacia]
MAIKKLITLESTGAKVEYHYVSSVTIDRTSKYTSATVMSYVSSETHAAGKQPVQGGIFITIEGIPADNEGAYSYVEKRLIEQKPADKDQPSNPAPYSMTDRYLLAGGIIVD